MNKLFFELVQVALGKRVCLSHTPRSTGSGLAFADEWKALYDMAKKQSLVGVCFAGVQRLQTQRQEPPEMLYLTWMGMAAKIQQRNQTVDEQCVALQKRLAADGLRSAFLKGQGVASLYSEHLRGLRQSGDIDVYVQGGMKKVMEWCRGIEPSLTYDYVHTHVDVFPDTEVEIHYRYGCLYNLDCNRRLQKWFAKNEEFVETELACGKIWVPSARFNVVYQLHHIYRHLFVEGIGLRQLMDYYFVLKSLDKKACEETASAKNIKNIRETLDILGLLKFAGAVMYVLEAVFGMEREYMICEPDEKEGKYLLERIMETGNFGHNREKKNGGFVAEWMGIVKHSMHLAMHYPSEALSAPIWHVYHFFWKRTSGRI